jgi:prolyl oligopeptidase
MRKASSARLRLAAGVAVLVACGPSAPPTIQIKHPIGPPPETHAEPAMQPLKHPWPPTRADELTETIQGQKIADPYRWLEDETSDDVQLWMKAQDDYARRTLASYPQRDELAARIKQLFYFDAIGAPLRRGARFFYSRKHVDKEKTIIYWKEGEHGGEHVLFDPNQWSADGSKGLHGYFPSYDGKHVAYQVSEHNSDETVMHVIDVEARKDLPDVIEGTKYAAASWTPDGKGFYYTWVPALSDKVTIAERPGFAELRFHALGTDPAKDPIVREATHDAETFLGGGVSRDGRWLFAEIQHGWNSTDLYFKNARDPKASWATLVAGTDATYDLISAWHDRFYIATNEAAPKKRVFVVDPKQPARAKWKEIVAQSDAALESAELLGDHLVLSYLRDATTVLEVHALDGKLLHKIAVPPLGSASIVGNPEDDTAYASYSSFTEPQIIYKTSIKTGKVDEWARVKLPVDTSGFVTDQVFVASKDGTKIPMFIIHRKDAKLDGTNPTILYGYGGFNVNMTPGFSGSRAVWLEHGGVYAIPNLRGGGEFGEEWHRAGMLAKKQNVFDDFIAAAEYLIAQKWTSREHLAISGGSNGGLLVGAAVTQRPDLYRAVICAVPLLDMLRFHKFGSGKTWVPEYGSADEPAQFNALYGYSPYRIAVDAGARAYPSVLFDSADHDDRVDPMHARKLAAVLQANQTGDAPILLRIERNSGHGGADVVKQQVERVVDQLSFLLHELK